MKTHRSLAAALLATAVCTPAAMAKTTWLKAKLDGVQSGTFSTATGEALVSYDDVTSQLTWTVNWKGLAGTPTDAHFHGPAAQGNDAGVQVGIGVASNPVSGSATITSTQAADLLGGLWYVNIHTTSFGSGEIRGQVLPALTNYWPLDDAGGTSATNLVPGAPAATLNGNVQWLADPDRGSVLSFDGVDGTYVNATTYGPVAPDTDATWTFWSNSNPAQPLNNDVIVGNRRPDEGWMKFTPNAYEFRDIGATFNATMDYPDFPLGAWVHNAVVKTGTLFTYYRNGVAQRNVVASGTMPEFTPLYFGGDPNAAGEAWQGLIDDVATFGSTLPPATIAALAGNDVQPDAAPLEAPAAPVQVFSDTFDGDLSQWTVTNRGLENNAAVGYDAPVVSGGAVTLGGTTSNQYWYGSSLESVDTFDSRLVTEVTVTRGALTGSGSAWRSSVWILGDAAHYLHFSQNVGETGWGYNARDDGGTGGLNPIGGGNNLALLDGLDFDAGSHVIRLRLTPGPLDGAMNVAMYVDGTLVSVHGFTNFPSAFRVVLTGQARATGDTVAAQFDDVTVRREQVANLPPQFVVADPTLPTATAGAAYSQSVTTGASDPENGALTFSLVSGPAWASVSPAGVLSGQPTEGDAGAATVRVRATDPGGLTAEVNFFLRVQSATEPPLTFFGHWPLNEGSGSTAANVAGVAANGTIANVDTGGLGPNGEAWVVDPECGPVLSFNGTDDSTATWVTVGDPGNGLGLVPAVGIDGDFTLTARVKSDQAPNNDIVVGNRYDPFNAEYVPRQFVKLTTSNFEWHWNGVGENVDFADMAQGVWVHHAIVKDGTSLIYYRDGEVTDLRTVTGAPNVDLPLYFGGQGVENWRGYLTDVRLYAVALSEAQVATVAGDKLVAGPDLVITEVTLDAGRNVTLTWNASAGFVYEVWASTTLTGWAKVADGLSGPSHTVNSGGNPNTATEPQVFYQVRAFPAN